MGVMTTDQAGMAGDVTSTAHSLRADEVARSLGVDTAIGLSVAEVARRAAASGPNELEEAPRTSIARLFWEALTEPFVVLLIVAGVLAVALGEVRDGLLVLLALLPIVGADVVTGYRGEKALDALRAASAPAARVRRDGTVDDVAAAGLVVGDIVLLRAGDVVPADLRLVRADRLVVDRSVLTGESVPEPAGVAVDATDARLPDRRSMAYAGNIFANLLHLAVWVAVLWPVMRFAQSAMRRWWRASEALPCRVNRAVIVRPPWERAVLVSVA